MIVHDRTGTVLGLCGRRGWRRAFCARVELVVSGVLACVLIGLVAVQHALACGPQPVVACVKSTSLVKSSSGPTLLANTSTLAPIGVQVFIATNTNANPPCASPLVTDIVLTSTCTPGPDALGPVGITIPTTAPGTYTATVSIPYPPGPARVCMVTGTASTFWSDGTRTTGMGDVTVCIVDPVPGNPSLPRLEMELISPANHQAHPGDGRVHSVRLTNNDPLHSVTGMFTATAGQNSRMNTMSPPEVVGSGNGPGSLAQPFTGDALPIDFGDQLMSPCVPLPDPNANTTVTINRTLSLAPGEVRTIDVRQRSWPKCRSGSCSEAHFKFDGMFDDGAMVKHCKQGTFMVNSLVPPDFEWSDNGMMCRAVPLPPGMFFQGNLPYTPVGVRMTYETTITSLPLNFQFNGSNPSVMDQGFGDNLGRISQTFLPVPVLNTGQMMLVTLDVTLTSQMPGVNLTVLNPMIKPGDPTLGDSYFYIDGRSRLSGPGIPPTLDSFFDVFYSVSLDGISGGLHRRSRIFPGTITAAPTGPTTMRVEFITSFDPVPSLPPFIERLDVNVDPLADVVGVPPRHDGCGGAYPVTEGVQFSGDTTNAIGTVDGPPGSCTPGLFHSVWHTFTPVTSGQFRIDTCGTNFDTVLVAFAGTCDAPAEVGCDDDSTTGTVPPCTPNGLASRIESIALNAGQTYLLRVGGFNATTNYGPYKLLVTRIPVNGACCCGARCTITTAAACIGPRRVFMGPATTCTPYSRTVPCCRGDYNKSGAPPSVQDIFDFLAGYFGGDPCADSNDSGGANSVQDIFDFLAAYFGGC